MSDFAEGFLQGQSIFPTGHQAGDKGVRRIRLNLPLGLPWRRVFCCWFTRFEVPSIYTEPNGVNDLPAGVQGSVTLYNGTAPVVRYPLERRRQLFPCRIVHASRMDLLQFSGGENEIGLRFAVDTNLAAILSPRTLFATADSAELEVSANELVDQTWTHELYLAVESFAASPSS